jgi:hypothetical protein
MVPMRYALTTTARIAAGIAAALVTIELALRLFATPGAAPRPDIAADSFESDTIVRRQIEEGVATARFTVHGSRLTGAPSTRAGVNAVVIGDSYVLAEQVGDEHTMGAQLERLARENGVPLDVRQYAWMGASPAQYLAVATQVQARWKPRRVFVVLSSNDFDHNALLFPNGPRFRVDAGDSLRSIGEPIVPGFERPRASVLARLARHRWYIIRRRAATRAAARAGEVAPHAASFDTTREAPPDSIEYTRVPRAVVRSLARAYGPALTLVYLPEVGIRGDTVPDVAERRLLDACREVVVDCVSTRRAMVEERRRGRVANGAGIAPIGSGHLNRVGHSILGRAMWERLRAAPVP